MLSSSCKGHLNTAATVFIANPLDIHKVFLLILCVIFSIHKLLNFVYKSVYFCCMKQFAVVVHSYQNQPQFAHHSFGRFNFSWNGSWYIEQSPHIIIRYETQEVCRINKIAASYCAIQTEFMCDLDFWRRQGLRRKWKIYSTKIALGVCVYVCFCKNDPPKIHRKTAKTISKTKRVLIFLPFGAGTCE